MDGNLPQRGGMATFNHLLIGGTLSPNNHSLQSVSDRLRLITDKCNSFASRGYSDQLVIFWVYSYINQGCHPAAALS